VLPLRRSYRGKRRPHLAPMIPWGGEGRFHSRLFTRFELVVNVSNQLSPDMWGKKRMAALMEQVAAQPSFTDPNGQEFRTPRGDSTRRGDTRATLHSTLTRLVGSMPWSMRSTVGGWKW
jgi:hypothetical protein